jgi:hypothetical protein
MFASSTAAAALFTSCTEIDANIFFLFVVVVDNFYFYIFMFFLRLEIFHFLNKLFL